MYIVVDMLKKNSRGIQALAQGLHALQDALAHQGVHMEHPDIMRDLLPGGGLYTELIFK